ncbi:E3 ubiquitin-protein ligase TRIM71-like [Saccostrea echinata]|uniref:E3 ubiquitin-protein ligase TRIM71-like n=1 Tax=Saccostrea echinata TaxID=191078 RepID=UPI002A7ED6F8|nr:E3 ubiquitin-protein ligase TRIM71-like [Saccostrea echinata]
MASNPDTNQVKCFKCKKPADFVCETCEGKFCNKCQKQHIKSKSKKNHQVSPLSERNTPDKDDTCTEHPSIKYDMCCKDCEVPVCVKCITENHVGHVFVERDTLYNLKRETIVSHISTLKNKLVPKCKDLHNEVLENITKCKQVMANMRIGVEEKAREIKDMVDAVLKKNMSMLERMEISLLQKLLLEERVISDQLTSMTDMLDELEHKLETSSPTQLIMTRSKLTMREEDIPHPNRIAFPEYHKKSVTEDKISKLFGEIIDSPDATEVPVTPVTNLENLYNNMTFSVRKVIGMTPPEIQYGRHISCMKDGRAWVSDRSSHMILLDIHGKTLDELSLKSKGDGYHCATINNNLLYIDKGMKRVNRFLPQEKKVESLFATPQHWASISIHSSWINQDILIGMYTKQEAKIVRFNSTGKELDQIQKNHKTGENLFCYPHYITESPSGDICTSDFEKFSVVAVNSEGQHKFTYKGSKKNQFFPHGICTDNVGNILVCDNQCQYRIHMLNPDGVFLRFLLSKEDGILEPLGLCLDDSYNLWLGQRGNESVTVFKYKQQENENLYM